LRDFSFCLTVKFFFWFLLILYFGNMDIERIFCAEQIQVPPDLARILREFTKAVIKEHPDDVVEFSWRYFKAKVEEKEKAELAEFNARMNGTHHG
jgi:hypothetical protein